MGRKVHPIGFRLGIHKPWAGRWFAEPKDYARQLHEDFAIRRLVENDTGRAGISRIEIERFPNNVVVTIWTARPGVVIGRRGAQVKELRTKLEAMTGTKVKVEVEVDEARLRPVDIEILAGDNSKVSALGWKKEITLQKSLEDIHDYWREMIAKDENRD